MEDSFMMLGVPSCAREKHSKENCMNTKARVFTIVVLAGLAAMYVATPLLAQSPSYPDFSSVSGLVVNPVEPPNPMQVNGNVLRINSANTGQVGSVWFNRLQPVAGGFSTTFTFQITPPAPSTELPFPADGFAFVIQNSAAGTAALGQSGGAMGYGGVIPVNPSFPGIDNSLAVEFDTFANDPWDFIEGVDAANHVAIQSCGTNPNTVDHTATYTIGDSSPIPCNLDIATAPVTLADGKPHTVQVEYNPPVIVPLAAVAQACNTCGPPPPGLQVTIDGTPVFASPVQVDLSSVLALASPTEGTADSAFVGFTGATGALVENNDILSWTFTSHGSQTITINNLPANTYTTFNFGSYLYKVRPNQNISTLAVTEVPTDPATFNAGSNFPTASCIIYDHTGNQCIEFHAECTGSTCTNVSYDVVTSYDVPAGTVINGPAFLKATGQPCTLGVPFDSNIITFFSQTRIDPTTKGSSKPTFSCFVAADNITYSPADVDITNVASSKVVTGSNLTYLIPVINFGPSTAQGVNLTDTIPTGTTFVSAGLCSFTNGCSANECSVSGGAVTCTVGSMNPFAFEVMVVVVHVTAPAGTVLNDTATSTAFNPDPRPADNVATVTTLVVNKKY
jgi:uncharacterized repeat protein (TIGR01451 family)